LGPVWRDSPPDTPALRPPGTAPRIGRFETPRILLSPDRGIRARLFWVAFAIGALVIAGAFLFSLLNPDAGYGPLIIGVLVLVACLILCGVLNYIIGPRPDEK